MPALSSGFDESKKWKFELFQKNGLDTNILNFKKCGEKNGNNFSESIGGTIQIFFYLYLITIYHNYKDG